MNYIKIKICISLVAVTSHTDLSVPVFIAVYGRRCIGDLSRFIEEAVRSYLLEKAVEQAKAAGSNMEESELTALIDEAVQWAREH